MVSRACVAFVCLLAASTISAPAAHAQDWARKMFDVASHDFGTVARGSKNEFYFTFTNLYKEDCHVAMVRSSCGCTEVTWPKEAVKTYQTGAVVAHLDTNKFSGQRHATLTVVFDKPFYAEVQLEVAAFIRTDVMLTPSGASFGMVDQGSKATKQLQLAFTGRPGWEITDIKVSSPDVYAEAVEMSRNRSQIIYQLTVSLKETAPAGYLKEQIVVYTNDRQNPTIPVDVEGQVLPSISVKPDPLFLGVLKPEQKVVKSLVVRGKQPFKISSITCPDERYSFSFQEDEEKTVHQVQVTYTADENPGSSQAKIELHLDQNGEVIAEVQSQAQIVK